MGVETVESDPKIDVCPVRMVMDCDDDGDGRRAEFVLLRTG